MDPLDGPLTNAEIEATAQRIAPFIRRTPVVQVDGADLALPGVTLAFKLEMLQHAGSSRLAARSTTCCRERSRAPGS